MGEKKNKAFGNAKQVFSLIYDGAHLLLRDKARTLHRAALKTLEFEPMGVWFTTFS